MSTLALRHILRPDNTGSDFYHTPCLGGGETKSPRTVEETPQAAVCVATYPVVRGDLTLYGIFVIPNFSIPPFYALFPDRGVCAND